MKVSLVPISQAPHEKAVNVCQPRFVIGRAADCDLQVDNPAVSRRHCVMTIDHGEVRLRDLGSRNGTSVNAEPLVDGEQILTDGDILAVVFSFYRVHIPATVAESNMELHETSSADSR